MVRSVAKQRVSNHDGGLILRDAARRALLRMRRFKSSLLTIFPPRTIFHIAWLG
jgi:hypothetical protein